MILWSKKKIEKHFAYASSANVTHRTHASTVNQNNAMKFRSNAKLSAVSKVTFNMRLLKATVL